MTLCNKQYKREERGNRSHSPVFCGQTAFSQRQSVSKCCKVQTTSAQIQVSAVVSILQQKRDALFMGDNSSSQSQNKLPYIFVALFTKHRYSEGEDCISSLVCLPSECSRLQQNTHFRKSGRLCTVYIISVVLQCPVNRVFCVYCMCGWGGPGVLSFQVNDDFDPCSSQILKPPAAWRTRTRCY